MVENGKDFEESHRPGPGPGSGPGLANSEEPKNKRGKKHDSAIVTEEKIVQRKTRNSVSTDCENDDENEKGNIVKYSISPSKDHGDDNDAITTSNVGNIVKEVALTPSISNSLDSVAAEDIPVPTPLQRREVRPGAVSRPGPQALQSQHSLPPPQHIPQESELLLTATLVVEEEVAPVLAAYVAVAPIVVHAEPIPGPDEENGGYDCTNNNGDDDDADDHKLDNTYDSDNDNGSDNHHSKTPTQRSHKRLYICCLIFMFLAVSIVVGVTAGVLVARNSKNRDASRLSLDGRQQPTSDSPPEKEEDDEDSEDSEDSSDNNDWNTTNYDDYEYHDRDASRHSLGGRRQRTNDTPPEKEQDDEYRSENDDWNANNYDDYHYPDEGRG